MLNNVVCGHFWSGPWGLGSGPSSSPWGTPTSARPGTDFRACIIEEVLLGIVKSIIWNFFWTPQTSWLSSRAHPHGRLQHQQGQELILELIYIEKHYCPILPRPFWPLGRFSYVQSLQFLILINVVWVHFWSGPWGQSSGAIPMGNPNISKARNWT